MSTMYYAYPSKLPIGQIHSLGKDKGTHFTWCIWPNDFFLCVCGSDMMTDRVIHDEYMNFLTFFEFQGIVRSVVSQSFDERIV